MTLWTQSDLLHRLLTAPVLYNGNLVVGDSEGYMHWVNPEDGHFVAQQKVDSSGFRTDAVVADGRLLIRNRRHAVFYYALVVAAYPATLEFLRGGRQRSRQRSSLRDNGYSAN